MMERITTPFGFFSTADEVAEGIDLSGKQVVITGGASEIGLETARALAHTGAEVTLAVRNTDVGKRAAADIIATTGNQLPGSTSLIEHQLPRLLPGGPDRWMSSSITLASWPYQKSIHLRAGKCSSPRITWDTLPWPLVFTTRWPLQGTRALSRSVPPGI
jgi:hypothetical protein